MHDVLDLEGKTHEGYLQYHGGDVIDGTTSAVGDSGSSVLRALLDN